MFANLSLELPNQLGFMPPPAQFPLEAADFSGGLRQCGLKLLPLARVKGDSVSAYAYLVFGFRQPVTTR